MKVALGQLDLCVGDIDGNTSRLADAIRDAGRLGADLLALPELAITGYPPEDLVLKRSFVKANVDALNALAALSDDLIVVIGFVEPTESALYNAAAVCRHGEVKGIYRKRLLPNYGVFDERRYFEPGTDDVLFDATGTVFAVCVCEDIWSPEGPAASLADAGARIVVNINASPFHKQKLPRRIEMLSQRAKRSRAAIVYVNAVGGQDELVFDGGSVVLSAEGEVIALLPQFEEGMAVVDVPPGEIREHADSPAPIELSEADHVDVRGSVQSRAPGLAVLDTAAGAESQAEDEVCRALVLALRDYVRKNGFEKVVVGLSGGIDSSLVATIAADALGDAVLGVAMPSEFSSSHSVDDAKSLAANLGIEFVQIPIVRPYEAYLESLDTGFGPHDFGLAEENIQARVRGTLLMAISNRYGHLVVATGNKSEMACGYATLYGDMAGGFALIKDVFKTEVYALARHRNSITPVIPEHVLTKPPSAELRPNQKDSDSLPPYDVLDPILELYIEHDLGVGEIERRGFERDLVRRIVTLVDRAEYKRRQAPPGPKVTVKAFGRDRRLPITNRWREAGSVSMPERSVGPGAAASPPQGTEGRVAGDGDG